MLFKILVCWDCCIIGISAWRCLDRLTKVISLGWQRPARFIRNVPIGNRTAIGIDNAGWKWISKFRSTLNCRIVGIHSPWGVGKNQRIPRWSSSNFITARLVLRAPTQSWVWVSVLSWPNRKSTWLRTTSLQTSHFSCDCTYSQPSLAPSAQRKRPHLVVHYDQPVEEQRGIRDLLGIVDQPFGGLGRPRSGFLRPDNSREWLTILYQPQVVRSYYPVENTTSSEQTLKKCFIRTSIKSCLVQLESSCKSYRARKLSDFAELKLLKT